MRFLIVGLIAALTLTGCSTFTKAMDTPPTESASTATSAAPTWPQQIPASLTLPHVSKGKQFDYGVTRLYNYICLDPPTRLTQAVPVDETADLVKAARTIYNGTTPTQERVPVLIERLTVYADDTVAQAAMSSLRTEVKKCGNTSDEQGYPLHWSIVKAVNLPTADDAFHINLVRAEPPAGWDPPHNNDGVFVTLVRVGNAVYMLDERPENVLRTPAQVKAQRAASEKEVRTFLPQLDVFRGTT
jgi:hypothetical protein